MFYTLEHTKNQTAKSESSLGIRSSCKSRKRKKVSQEVKNEGEALKQERIGQRTFDMARAEVIFTGCHLYGDLWNLSG